ncbi:MAG: hypothetical protein NTU76_01290, partial [Candidatus Taylorbacteria bacterium]|nr:hypothetical protein [Candidatus Taylorbacteria bacterium]
MSPFLIFILGVILSSVFWSILNLLLRRKRVIKGEKAKLKEESNHRTKEKFDPDSESLQTIELKKLDKPQDAYYQNDEVFITFCLEELKKQSINIRTLANALRPAEGFQMIEFKIINRTYSLLL